jgi:hypothetical protein
MSLKLCHLAYHAGVRAPNALMHVHVECSCGAKVDMSPYYDLVNKGVDPQEAWDRALPVIKDNTVHGFWTLDVLAGTSGNFPNCPLPEVL